MNEDVRNQRAKALGSAAPPLFGYVCVEPLCQDSRVISTLRRHTTDCVEVGVISINRSKQSFETRFISCSVSKITEMPCRAFFFFNTFFEFLLDKGGGGVEVQLTENIKVGNVVSRKQF